MPEGQKPLIAHLVFRLDYGGLENGVVNLINGLPLDKYRHAVICLTEASDFQRRITRPDVSVFELHKPPGKAPKLYWQLWRLLRTLKPAIVHTRNLGTLEAQIPAFFAGVPGRIHSEHGWDVGDLDGSNRKNRLLRRLVRPFVQRYVALSKDLGRYLTGSIRVADARLAQIYNGVDAVKFHPAAEGGDPLPEGRFAGQDLVVFGSVGRLQTVKDQPTLIRAFIDLLQREPDARARARLLIAGDGSLMPVLRDMVEAAGIGDLVWLAGARDDVAQLMRGMDVFVLPSLSEGVSNTILEAMATGLPVIATRVGGNPELVEEGVTGTLVSSADPLALAQAMQHALADAQGRQQQGRAARLAVEQRFSMPAMLKRYEQIYDGLLG